MSIIYKKDEDIFMGMANALVKPKEQNSARLAKPH